MSRTELWEAQKDAHLTGHFGFSVDDAEHVHLPYAALAQLLQAAGLRRKVTTHHEPRVSLHPAAREPAPAPEPPPTLHPIPEGHRPPPGYRWVAPRECHGSDQFCERCSPNSPERRVTRLTA